MIAAILRVYWRPLAVAAALLTIATGIGLYGHVRYRAGQADARAEIAAQTRAVEAATQGERDRADAKYRGAVLAREAAQKDTAAVRARLDGLLRNHGRDSANPRAGRRPDEAGPDWIGGFAACYAEYADLAADAAEWADRLNGLQGYVRAVRSRR